MTKPSGRAPKSQRDTSQAFDVHFPLGEDQLQEGCMPWPPERGVQKAGVGHSLKAIVGSGNDSAEPRRQVSAGRSTSITERDRVRLHTAVSALKHWPQQPL